MVAAVTVRLTVQNAAAGVDLGVIWAMGLEGGVGAAGPRNGGGMQPAGWRGLPTNGKEGRVHCPSCASSMHETEHVETGGAQ